MKAKKSYTSRFRVTKNGKIMRRASGQDHFNSRDSGQEGVRKRRISQILLPKKIVQRYLSN